MHVQYGKFAQMPALRQALTGGARLALETGGQNFINALTAFDLEPMRDATKLALSSSLPIAPL